MSAYTIDLSSHGKELKQAYDSIVSSDPSVSWAVFNYEGQTNVLKVSALGASDLDEFVEEFLDGKVQYGFARVDYNNLPKFVLVGWVGEGVPERAKGYFNAHYSTVSKYFHGYHVQITARNSNDLSTSIIVDKIHNASGSKYSSTQPSRSGAIPLRPNYKVASTGAAEDDWGGAPPVVESNITKVQSAYKPTKVDISSIKSSSTKVEPVQGTYQPTGKVDIAAIRAAGKTDRFADDRPTPLQSSYKPIGKVDIAAIRAQANAKSEVESAPVVVTPVAPASGSSANDSVDTERTLNVKDRLKTWGTNAEPEAQVESESVHSRIDSYSTTSGRLTELPKLKVSNTVGSRFSGVAGGATRGTAPALPKTSSLFAGESKAAAGFKNYGAENGKSPAQLWAEKHARSQQTASVASEPVREAPVVHVPEPAQEPEQEQEYEKPDMSALRSQFSRATVEETPAAPLRTEPPIQQTRFSDITSRFAQGNTPTPAAAPVPVAEDEPEPAKEKIPPPPVNFSSRPPVDEETIAIPTPVARHAEPEPEPVHEVPAAAAASGTVAIAAYDYDKDEENEISLKEGELVTDIEFVDTDWWSGKNSRGEAGLFPSSYVEVQQEVGGAELVHEPAHEEPTHEEPAHEEPAHEEPAPSSSGPSARAEYDYEATEDGELSFPEGAVITEIDFVDEAWWSGVYGGVRALFPANYVTLQE